MPADHKVASEWLACESLDIYSDALSKDES